ncbi:MAG: class I SAM-dependent methyltransferase [Myxococcaceae bacterium]
MTAPFRAALELRRAKLPPDTTCFRLSDEDVPGVTVDRFGTVAILSTYRDVENEQELADALLGLDGLTSVYVKRRPREARKVANEKPEALAPPTPLAGTPVDELEVLEQGLRFVIRPPNGLSVGLYLDARDARAVVREHAKGRKVLNTFSYTCGFGVAALAGGATRAVNVDASRKVLDWGEENTRRNGHEPTRLDFIAGDTFDWLTRFAKKGETFDFVILDPPGFATTKTSRFTAKNDYHRLVKAAADVLAPNGLLLAMCNVEQSPREFDAQLARGLGARKSKELRRFSASAIDFTAPSSLQCRLLELPAR